MCSTPHPPPSSPPRQIAADYLQELPAAPSDPRHFHHGLAGPGPAPWLAALCRCMPCCWVRSGPGGSAAYAPVRSSGDYDEGL